MTAPRFFHPPPLPHNTLAELPEAAAHHALRVLRLRDGQAIELFDGVGWAVSGTLRVAGRKVQAQVGEARQSAPRRGQLTLYQGIPASDRMDWVVEKATELGVARIVPVLTRRTVLKLQGERRERRWQHWQRIVLAACAQSGRNDLLEVLPPLPWAEALVHAQGDGGLHLLCHPEAPTTLTECLRQQAPEQLALWVGPEGGWEANEYTEALRAGVHPVRHGALTLRSETAGLALAAASSALLGWVDA